jgi:hypothetical protein
MKVHIILKKDSTEEEIVEAIHKSGIMSANEGRDKKFGIITGNISADIFNILKKLPQVESIEEETKKSI